MILLWLRPAQYFSYSGVQRPGIARGRKIERRRVDSAYLGGEGAPKERDQDRCHPWASLGNTGKCWPSSVRAWNCSHGDFADPAERIKRIRSAEDSQLLRENGFDPD
jgi:hypothetical protein